MTSEVLRTALATAQRARARMIERLREQVEQQQHRDALDKLRGARNALILRP